MSTYIYIFGAAFLGGLVQTVTGFGSVIMMMLFVPLFFPMMEASAICAAITLLLNLGLTLKHRKAIHWRLILLPALFYCAFSVVAMLFAERLPVALLKRLFGGFLLALAVYFLFVRTVHLKGSPLSAIGCASLSGITHGAFGAGGPPMAVYFLAVLPERSAYIGTMETFYLLTGTFAFAFRIVSGIFTLRLVPFTAVGMVAVLGGMAVGNVIADHLNAKTLRMLIYILLAFSGFVYLLQI